MVAAGVNSVFAAFAEGADERAPERHGDPEVADEADVDAAENGAVTPMTVRGR